MYDLIIIGGGPAGTAAAVYAARKQLKTLLLTAEFGGQSAVSLDIQNWIGNPSISGEALAHAFKAHVEASRGNFLTVMEGMYVTLISKNSDGTFLITAEKNTYTARSIFIASGSSRRKLEVPGAKELENKGISYCASCDGPLFADQDVAVIGGGNAAFETVAQLVAYCKSVTLIHRNDNFKADEITVAKILTNPKVHVVTNAEITSIVGSPLVASLTYKDLGSQKETTLPVTGVFVEIGQIPNTSYISTLPLDSYNRIPVDPRTQRTSLEGIWAAGDCTDGLYHQNNIAAGDAVKALEDIYLWLHNKTA